MWGLLYQVKILRFFVQQLKSFVAAVTMDVFQLEASMLVNTITDIGDLVAPETKLTESQTALLFPSRRVFQEPCTKVDLCNLVQRCHVATVVSPTFTTLSESDYAPANTGRCLAQQLCPSIQEQVRVGSPRCALFARSFFGVVFFFFFSLR